jgi:VWFA-related protein
VALAAGLGLSSLSAGEPASTIDAERGEITPAESVEVRLVQVAISARDRRGRPVTHLVAGDIVAKDRGRRLRIAFLEPFAGAPQGEDLPDVRLHVAVPGGGRETIQSGGVEPRYVIFLIDVQNDHLLRRPQATEDTLRFVREGLDSSFRAAVLSYDGRLNLDLNFTTDRQDLEAAIRNAYGRPPRPRLELHARMRALLGRLEDCAVRSGTFTRVGDESCLREVMLEYADETRPEAEDYLDALDGLVRFAGGVQGWKTVLSLSHGIAADPTTELIESARAVYGNTEQLARLQLEIDTGEGSRARRDALLERAVEERVAFHVIDRTPTPSGDFGARQGGYSESYARPIHAAFMAVQTESEQLAIRTGGSFTHSADVFSGLNRALDLERGSYLLGYYVDEALPCKRLLKIDIDTTKRGVRIVHPDGKCGADVPTAALPGSISVGHPIPLTEPGRNGQFLPFTMLAEPTGLGYEASGEEATANLTLHFRILGRDGRSLAESYHFINHTYPRDLWLAGQVEAIQIHGWIELPPGEYHLAATFHNPRTGHGGELSQDVVIVSAH